MADLDHRYAAAPPAPPPRDQLISGEIEASRRTPGAKTLPAIGKAPVRPYTATAVPTPFARQVMNRFAWGFSPETWAQLKRAGGPEGWFRQQLRPERIADPQGDVYDSWYPDRMRPAAAKWETVFDGTKYQWEYAVDLANWSLLRRSHSTRQLHEVMTDFWSNHFHIPSVHDLAWCWRNHYDAVLRRNAFGRFEDLLLAVELHPSMLLFLSNFESTKEHPNENQGRELLELHTVGITGGYTEEMVKDSARILTGFTVGVWGDWKPYYEPSYHARGPVTVLGFTDDNGAADGQAVARRYLRYLANHPATARTIATKLALRFVSDDPSPELVNHLTRRFLASGTDIAATLRALFSHPEFAAAQDAKVRNPIEDFVATVRALDVHAKKPRGDWPFADAQIWMCQGQYPFQWPRPDGMPQTNGAWSSASQVLGSLDVHYSMAGGWIGEEGSVRYHRYRSWMPQDRLRFDALVDHLSRRLLGRPSTELLLTAACQATGCVPRERVDQDHALPNWLMPRLLTAILDTPAHLSR